MKNWLANYVIWLGIAIAVATVVAACSLVLAGKMTESVAVLAWVAICYLLLRRATCKVSNNAEPPQDDAPDVQPH